MTIAAILVGTWLGIGLALYSWSVGMCFGEIELRKRDLAHGLIIIPLWPIYALVIVGAFGFAAYSKYQNEKPMVHP